MRARVRGLVDHNCAAHPICESVVMQSMMRNPICDRWMRLISVRRPRFLPARAEASAGGRCPITGFRAWLKRSATRSKYCLPKRCTVRSWKSTGSASERRRSVDATRVRTTHYSDRPRPELFRGKPMDLLGSRNRDPCPVASAHEHGRAPLMPPGMGAIVAELRACTSGTRDIGGTDQRWSI